LRHEGAEPAPAKVKQGESGEQSLAEQLIQLALINGILLVLVPLLVRLTSGASLADFGLSLLRWKRQMAIGVGAAFLMTPAVYAIQSLAVRIWKSRQHPVEQMVLDQFSIGIAILAMGSTVVLAPMIEELLFRGIVQRWLTRALGNRTSSL